MKNFLHRYYITILIAISLVAIWVALTSKEILNPVFFPTMGKIFDVYTKAIGQLGEGFLSSMGLLIPALLLSLVLGIGGGIYIGMNARIREVLTPFFHTFAPLPPTLFIPYLIALLPTFSSASIAVLFIGAFWPIFLGTVRGVLLIDKHFWDNAKTIGLKGKDLILRLVLPASAPYILSGTGTSLGMSFIVLMMAEMFGAQSGMGYFIQYYTDFSQFDYVMAGIIFNSVIILAIMVVFERVKKRILFWTNLKNESV